MVEYPMQYGHHVPFLTHAPVSVSMEESDDFIMVEVDALPDTVWIDMNDVFRFCMGKIETIDWLAQNYVDIMTIYD